jgi:hypothetical protein
MTDHSATDSNARLWIPRGAALAIGLVASLLCAELAHAADAAPPPDPVPMSTIASAPTSTTTELPADAAPAAGGQTTSTTSTTASTSTSTTTSTTAPASTSTSTSTSTSPALAVDDTYSLTVDPVCDGGATPAVDVTSTGTGGLHVTVGSAEMDLTAAQPFWHAPWPTIGRAVYEPAAGWTAVQLDDPDAVVDSGTLTLPPDCPPAPTVPSAPDGISSTPGDRSVSLSWLPPASSGSSPVSGYTIEYQADGAVA